MPLLPTKRKALVAVVGGAIILTAIGICSLAGASAEVTTTVATILGAWLATVEWAVGERAEPPELTPEVREALVRDALRNRVGPTSLVLLLLAGCASTMKPIQRDAVELWVHAGLQGAAGALQYTGQEGVAEAVLLAEPGVADAVRAGLEYPADTATMARGICEAAFEVLHAHGQDTAARIVAVMEPVVRWALDQALLEVEKKKPPASAEGSSDP